MKNSLLILMILFFANITNAQHNNYEALWLKVEKFEIEGLPKSALKIVNDIALKAKKDNNAPQLIKTLLFKSKFALILEDDAQLSIINDFKTNIETSSFPVKNVLESLLANLYWQYFKQHRWQFYNRTKTDEKINTTDFRTWDLQTLFTEIHVHYQNSLQNGLMLQLENLANYDAILNTHKDSKIYRPTLFDFLNHNALEFYKTNETHITKPAYKFEIDNPDFLANAKIFSTLNITSKDSTSLQLQALKIYQHLIQFHLKNKNPKALANVNIERLKFVEAHATFTNQQTLLLNALKTERLQNKTHETSALYDFEIASMYVNLSKTYNTKTNKEHRFKAKEALAICNTAITNFSESLGAQKCKILKTQILQPTLNITTENYLPTQQHAKVLVSYKNIDSLYFKAYKLNEKQFEKFGKIYNKDDKWEFLNKLNATKSWSNTLRNENDYLQHSTELLLPKLNNGRYIILATNKQNNSVFFAYTTIQITNIALVDAENNTHQIFQLINRNNGEPMANATIEMSYSTPYNGKRKLQNYTTDSQGRISIKKTNSYYRNITIEASYNNETAYFGNYWMGSRQNKQQPKTAYKAFVFTDRSIYRPGQTVFFKAIALKTKNNTSEVLANENLYAVLYNANSEEIKELELKTNEYGAVNGQFILPNTGLNGQYYIEIDGDRSDLYTNHYFSVEEYKRPKFETTFKTVKETYTINDSVTVKGNAIAFTGSNITNAKVVYRVHRKVQYPHWFYWYRPNFNSEPQEITHGETVTNANGEFSITFKALPDSSVDKESLPIFRYEITADVTDLNGETRSATTLVNVGYHALTANIIVNSVLNKSNKEHTINIETKNLNGEFAPAKGSIKIYKLKAPNNVVRPRPWPAPDYQDFSKENFKNLFPNEAYTNEHLPNEWEKGALVLNKTFNTETSKTLHLGKIKKWQSGQYIIILETKDKFGKAVKDETKITLFSDKDDSLADNQLFNITTNKTTYNAGEIAYVTLASAAKNIAVTVSIEKNHDIIKTQIVKLNNNKKVLSIPVSQNDIGGFAIHYSYAAYNSAHQGTLPISVPYPITNLQIETNTFRDRLQPGTNETWSFNIKGPKSDKVSAELLASMYDASLDQFKDHNWHFNPIYKPNYYSAFRNNMQQSFGTKGFKTYSNYNISHHYPNLYYDSWNWFGFSMNFNKWTYNRYLNTLRPKHTPKHQETFNKTFKEGIITGTIYDETGEPLPGANITITGTNNKTTTDFDGKFTIEAKKGNTLKISFLGYLDYNVTINKNNVLNITLVEDSAQLDEVVVTGYGTQKRKELTGAVAEVVVEEAEVSQGQAMIKGQANDNELNIPAPPKPEKQTKTDFSNIKIRKNLNETAFFFPHLKTDDEGNVSFSFTTPEALTQWKLQLLAHTKNLESATKTLTTVTQKELMVTPNAPRFLREGDSISISTKISNLTEKELSGKALLILTDAISGKDITSKLFVSTKNNASTLQRAQNFTVSSKNNTQVSWRLLIPDDVQAIQYKIVAKSESFSDGEQNALPVLSNRMLVTETLPMWIKSNETKTFSLEKLVSTSKNNEKSTLKHHKLTLEITSNPAWYAVQALPYLMEYPYECNEQTFSRYYANALASHIVNSNPRIKEVFNQWASQDALISNLEKNEELKSILIQETPWLRDAKSETEQKKRIALLFNLNKMNNELQLALNKLKNNQMSSGAWPWFNGGYENRWITQHIITGFGHLQKLEVIHNNNEVSQMIKTAINFLDEAFVKEYKNLKKYNKNIDLNKDHLSHNQLHYLYMRSFFPQIKTSKEVENIIAYYQSQIQKYWLNRSLYAKGLMALISYRTNDTQTASKILKSLKENSITNQELGMYWKENTNSWFWYQAPIETQALLIEAFSETGTLIQNEAKNLETIDNLKIWLLKNKQTNRWKTTKATTEAVYALLLQGNDWISVTEMVDVSVGGSIINPSKLKNSKIEAGTGYFKTSWNAQEIKPNMGNVTLTKKDNGVAWGGLYWQYFEDLDKITSAAISLNITKKLFLKQHTDTGEEISEITPKTSLTVGDLVRVRIEIKNDRPMEFVHMKDMRAAGLEPINVISTYKWHDGLGYYESTKDASTNFFFDYLPKGVFVFEYDLRVNNAGNMSNGITTIQSMYAPEFSSHSKGVRIQVK
ncbi:alpha-2-macroglobulin [Seonamhaeicola algicola]|uniref:Alpha-2-macroglobulin n=1 Tax=Seonamhaeicola algicola TaxID=1719036 RepID=A0A5C7ANB4_9FLAO|nr:carboxypeptidase-like regulatory domain-containing protein [Seonamhaeicola algicola]TXE09811.1 alpha-2-macroglobulin [Seonamhaeicola algicola]